MDSFHITVCSGTLTGAIYSAIFLITKLVLIVAGKEKLGAEYALHAAMFSIFAGLFYSFSS